MRTNYLTDIYHFEPKSERITKISRAEFPSGFSSAGSENTDESNNPAPKSTELVSISPAKHTRAPKMSHHRQSAPLVAQLIATHLELPQTRTRRRTSFRSADLAYMSGKTDRAAGIKGIRVAKKA